MPPPQPTEHDWARRLLLVAWLTLLGYVAIAGYLVNRARQANDTDFTDGVWEQRLEILSFVGLPQQTVVLLVGAAFAAASIWITRRAGGHPTPWQAALVPSVLGIVAVVVITMLASIVSLLTGDASGVPDQWGDVYLRVGGIATALGAAVLVVPARQTPAPPVGSGASGSVTPPR